MNEKTKLQLEIRDLENEISTLINRKRVLTSEISNLIDHRKTIAQNISSMEITQSHKFEELKPLDIDINKKRQEAATSKENIEKYQDEVYKQLDEELLKRKLKMEQKEIIFKQREEKLSILAHQVKAGQKINEKEAERLLNEKNLFKSQIKAF